MAHFIGQYWRDEAIYLHRESMVLNSLGLLAKDYFNEFQSFHMPTIDNDLGEFGMVYTEITAFKKGVVRFQNAWWFALSSDHGTIHPGQQVRVTELQGATLLVELDP